MQTFRRQRAAWTRVLSVVYLPAFLSLVLLASCGGDGLEQASEELARIESEVEEARVALDQRKRESDEVEETVEQARRALEEAEQRLATATKNVARQVNDAVLFREVQGRLLDDGDLEGVAISAQVERRIVTLEGNVYSEAQKLRAEEIAKDVAGVETVVNQIDIDVAMAPE